MRAMYPLRHLDNLTSQNDWDSRGSAEAPDAEEPVGGGKLKTRPHKESGEFCDSRAIRDSSKSLP